MLLLCNVICTTQFSHVTMEHEVACIDITPLTDNKQCAELCALGLWTDISVRVLKLPTLDAIHCQLLGGGVHYME